MKRYPEYKESGRIGLEDQPKHWEVVVSISLVRNQRDYEGEPLLSVPQDQILPRDELDYRVWDWRCHLLV